MTNDIDKYSDIGVNEVPHAEGCVFTGDLFEKSECKEDRDKFLSDKQNQHDVLLANLQD